MNSDKFVQMTIEVDRVQNIFQKYYDRIARFSYSDIYPYINVKNLPTRLKLFDEESYNLFKEIEKDMDDNNIMEYNFPFLKVINKPLETIYKQLYNGDED